MRAEEAEIEHKELQNFIPLPVKGGAVDAWAEGVRAERCTGFPHAHLWRYHGQS